MATINFENHGGRTSQGGKQGPPATTTGINTSGLTGWNFDRTVTITAALSTSLKVPIGIYEHVGEDASGNWTYAPVTRNL